MIKSKQGKTDIGKGGIILILIMVLALLIYFAGFGIASGIIKILGSIPTPIWIFILIMFLLFSIGGNKK